MHRVIKISQNSTGVTNSDDNIENKGKVIHAFSNFVSIIFRFLFNHFLSLSFISIGRSYLPTTQPMQLQVIMVLWLVLVLHWWYIVRSGCFCWLGILCYAAIIVVVKIGAHVETDKEALVLRVVEAHLEIIQDNHRLNLVYHNLNPQSLQSPTPAPPIQSLLNPRPQMVCGLGTRLH